MVDRLLSDWRVTMSQTGLRRTRDKLLFALAYGAVIAAVLFLHPCRKRATRASSPPMSRRAPLRADRRPRHWPNRRRSLILPARTAVPGSAPLPSNPGGGDMTKRTC